MQERSKKRKFRRNLTINKLITVVLELQDEDTTILGMIIDSSKNGVQLTVPQKLAPQTVVRISLSAGPTEDNYKTTEFSGIVRWCKPNELAESTYDIGIEIKD